VWIGNCQNLLAFALDLDALEDMSLFAMGLSWHWDMENLGLNVFRYRELIPVSLPPRALSNMQQPSQCSHGACQRLAGTHW